MPRGTPAKKPKGSGPDSGGGPAKPPRGSAARERRPNHDPGRPLYTAGGLAAAWAAAVGLATLMTIALIGWVAAPHSTFGEDIGDVFQVAVQGWLVGHQAGFAIPGGRVGMLPMGLAVLPGILLYRSGRWLARSCDIPDRGHLLRAALALAGPYAAIAGTLALLGQTDAVKPSMFQALAAGFLLAFIAGGLGVVRQVLVDRDIARRRLLKALSPRSRSLLVGTLGATLTLLATGTLLFFISLALDFGEAVELTNAMSPGIVGGVLLFILQVVYLPNAIVFGVSYAVGPGFAVGTGTMVAPTGIAVGPLPQLPMLAALPDNGPAPVFSLIALAAPFIAGGVGGALTVRSSPTQVSEAAPMWGFVCGAMTAAVCAGLAVLAGGPVGAERLASVGPSVWQVGLVTALEVGLSAAIVAWFANWWHFRPERAAAKAAAAEQAAQAAESADADTSAERPAAAVSTDAAPIAVGDGDRDAGGDDSAAVRPAKTMKAGKPKKPKKPKKVPPPPEPPLAEVLVLPERRPLAERTGSTPWTPTPAAEEPVDYSGPDPSGGDAEQENDAAGRRRSWLPGLGRRSAKRNQDPGQDDDAELYGITYEADGDPDPDKT